jgi:DNA-binding beta-propeller fold protein YncE
MIGVMRYAALAAVLAGASAWGQQVYFQSPSGSRYAEIIPGKESVLPNGRLLTPVGKRLYGGEDVWNTYLSPNDKTLAVISDSGLRIYPDFRAAKPESMDLRAAELTPAGREEEFKGIGNPAPAAVFSPDGSRLFLSMGDSGRIVRINTATWKADAVVNLNTPTLSASYAVDMLLSKDGKTLYVADVAHQRILTLDAATLKVIHSAEAGRQPYALALSEDGRRLFVANIGLFDYTIIPPTDDPAFFREGLTRPPFGFPSRPAREGVEFEGRQVAGLGDHLNPNAHSVFQYDLASQRAPRKVREAKTGTLIRAITDRGPAVGGSAPCALAVVNGKLFVSNSNNDTVQAFDERTLKPVGMISLTPRPELQGLRGVIPSGLAVDKARQRLYVCESGLNSVAAIDLKTMKVLGRTPTGWFPMQVRLTKGGGLVTANQKGIGRGPRGPLSARQPGDERFGMPDFPGMALVAGPPTFDSLRAGHQKVLGNNGLNPVSASSLPIQDIVPTEPGVRSKAIKHVVLITKENHTFDGIFGGLPGSKSEPAYAAWGINGWLSELGQDKRLPIMPNHWKTAQQFAISDNFYMEPQASGDGHRWLVGVYPSLWTSRNFYAGWSWQRNDSAKGRLGSMGSNGSQIPEDYLENGSMWEHFERNGVSFRNYGEGFEFPGQMEPGNPTRTGSILQVNHPINQALWNNTDWGYPVYNTNIPDIARVEWLKEDVEKTFRSQGKALPEFINITLCNDHGDRARPDDGYPYVGSYMADNDLAMGRLIEYLSQQPEWENMLILITQDDSGGDADHIDRHRSFIMAVGPHAKKGYVSNVHTSIMSIHKTIYQIFGMGPLNMFDAASTDLRDLLTDKPDAAPYAHVGVPKEVFDPMVAFNPDDPRLQEKRWLKPNIALDDPNFMDWLYRQQFGLGEGS